MSIKSSFLLLLIVPFGACKSQREVPAATPVKLVSIQTFPCRGYCPVYTITVYDDGLLEYNGERFVEKMGTAKATLTREELAQLRMEVTTANLWTYPEDIQSKIMDAPFTTLTVWQGDKSKSVRGSIDRPKPLLELEKRLKNTAEAHGLKVLQGVNPNANPAPQGEVIVQLRPEENAGNWIAQFKQTKLQLVRRLQDNTWLVSYDPARIEEQQVIDLLKATDGALEVQTNRPVKDRN